MKQGALVYDEQSGRMDIRFGLEAYYGGLHCGTTMEVFIEEQWRPTRIELSANNQWYLVGVPAKQLAGLLVRL